MSGPAKVDWPAVIAHAAELVDGAGAMSLAELFNALVDEGLLRPTRSQYVGLQRETGRARAEGRFPALTQPPRGGRALPPVARRGAPVVNRLTDQQADYLGPALVRWGEDHDDAVRAVRDAARGVGWWLRGHTAVLVAVAQQARDELAAEAAGAAPSLRAVYYRLVARFGMEKTLRAYQLLVSATTTARERGVMNRRAFVDHKTPEMATPGDWTVVDALEAALSRVARPTDAFVDTDVIVAVVCEARGMTGALAGALQQRLGFSVPVWATAGQVSIPFGAALEDAMREWTEGRDAHVLAITDYDPAGLIIASNIGRRANGVMVHRVGVWPAQAERYGAPTAEGIEELLKRSDDDDDTNPQERARVWEAAVAEHGAVKVQAEALGPAAWADLIREALDRLLTDRSADVINAGDLARNLRERRAGFKRADDVIGKLRDALAEVSDGDDPVREFARRLGLEP
jgi:hypothetical protein